MNLDSVAESLNLMIRALVGRADGPIEIVSLSGGFDSTAMALRLSEVEPAPAHRRWFVCTPTGDELPEMQVHWRRLSIALGQPVLSLTLGSLDAWIEHWQALPNPRMRWCTRVLKLKPMEALFKQLPPGSISCVGLRADEPERTGIVGDSVPCRFPLREWGWTRADVVAYVRAHNVVPPDRTDCARCPFQRLSEWWALWRYQPEIYAAAAAQEAAIGHTFRSARRDSWPAALADMAERFAVGERPGYRGDNPYQVDLLELDDGPDACRVCRL